MTDSRRAPKPIQALPINNTLSALTLQALDAIDKNPGVWYRFAGPFTGKAARLRAHQARKGRRWASVQAGRPGMEFRSWTDPDDSQVYVLARLPHPADAEVVR